ncbi:hypothetical protein, partial [Dactylosporangium sp. NPDC048998]|uniref:hypothetical protein n=1 Tax=Dactylosporangium sp. NPDC048998 TaxID=3363976 RepID=UPI0037186925
EPTPCKAHGMSNGEPKSTMPSQEATRRRSRAAGGVIALSLAAVMAAACTTGPHPEPQPTSAAPSTSATAPACSPRVLESGFARKGADFWYGFIVENPCDQAAVQNLVTVQPMTASGTPAGEPQTGLANVPVLLPGQRLGIGGLLHVLQGADTVATLSFNIPDNDLLPAGFFKAWPRSATARNVTYGPPDAGGYVSTTFEIVTDPPNTPMCQPVAHIIARDKAGHIVYGNLEPIKGPMVSLSVPFPASADLSKTEIYVEQGQYVFGRNLQAVACSAAA